MIEDGKELIEKQKKLHEATAAFKKATHTDDG